MNQAQSTPSAFPFYGGHWGPHGGHGAQGAHVAHAAHGPMGPMGTMGPAAIYFKHLPTSCNTTFLDFGAQVHSYFISPSTFFE